MSNQICDRCKKEIPRGEFITHGLLPGEGGVCLECAGDTLIKEEDTDLKSIKEEKS